MDDQDEDISFQPNTAVVLSMHHLNTLRACTIVLQLVSALISELDDECVGDYSVNHLLPKTMRLQLLAGGHISLFKSTTGLYPHEFELICQQVCPILSARSRATNAQRKAPGRPPKLNPSERLLSTILYLRDNNTVRTECSQWNYSRTSLCTDVTFICSIINEAMGLQIALPNAQRRQILRNRIPELPGCIGFVDGTLCRIRRPASINHRAYFNGRKKMYCFNSAVVIDHDGFFIFVAAGYAGSFHDISVLRHTDLSQHWQEYFTVDHNSPYPLEYLLGDPGYMGMDHFMLRRIDVREVPKVQNDPVLRAFNRLHSGFRVAVEWGIGGLKQKYRKLLYTCPNRRDAFELMFITAAILTNFVHRQRQNFDIEVVAQNHPDGGGWAN